MNFTPPFQDSDRAVSPVIGVILMVAITVILAAVIGSFVLELGGSVNSVPQASFDFDTEEADNGTIENITIVHNGGDTIEVDRLNVTGAVENSGSPIEFTNSDVGSFSSGESFSAGDEITITSSDDTTSISGEEGDVVRVVFTSEGGGSSNVVASFELPSDGAGTS